MVTGDSADAAVTRQPAARLGELLIFTTILVFAGIVRMWSLRAGVPFAVGVDEPAVVDRALRILRTGDWNTHVFDYPTLVIYFHTIIAAIASFGGVVLGWWGAPAGIDIVSVYTACRLAAAAVGIATVWLVYGLARELGGPAAGLAAAALVAVVPMHVRESHYILTDVPAAALVAAALWLAVRAGDTRRLIHWTAAGAVSGLAAGAKYNGAVVLGAVLLAAVAHERGWRARGRAVACASCGAVLAYCVAAPFTLLDIHHFTEGFSAQVARFSGDRPAAADPVWLVYLKHLALNGTAWLWAAGAGLVALAFRRDWRRAVAPASVLVLYAYVLATHSLVFGRYALPLVPVLCVFAGIGIAGFVDLAGDRFALPLAVRRSALVLLVLFVASGLAIRTVAWLQDFDGPDTRRLVAEWMRAALPAGSRVAVDVSGPTNLTQAGFRVAFVPRLPADDQWYARQRIDYALFAWRGSPPRTPSGTALLEILPTPRRWGPAIRVIQVNRRPPQRP